jgi:hypothetical protein
MKTATKTYTLLEELYKESGVLKGQVSEWHKQFSEERENVHDDSRPYLWCFFVTKKELSTQNLVPKDNMSICYFICKFYCI